MTNERWQKINELFHAALERAPDERDSFLKTACEGDKTLLEEVEKLVSDHQSAGEFIQQAAFLDDLQPLAEPAAEQELIGKQFGAYEIVRKIGRGGMGSVYLARDTKLDRKVAVKLLNPEFAGNESNLNRFIQEAKAASALNHPNILVIHEVREGEAGHYIVCEFIEGQTLREILKERSLNLEEIIDISIQITTALIAAHATNIIHRDIKPENVMVRPDGLVKILDFGVAKLIRPEPLGPENKNPQTNETAKGVILGTINYMSPEQAKGEPVDARSDIFSLGVMVYEMIAGRTPFEAETALETLANLIKTEPQPLLSYVSNVPDELQNIITKMLSKNRDERYQAAKDLLHDLKNFQKRREFEIELGRTPGTHKPVDTDPLILETVATDNLPNFRLNNSTEKKSFARFGVGLLVLLSLLGLIGYIVFNRNRTAGPTDNKNPDEAQISFKTTPNPNSNQADSSPKTAGEISKSDLPNGAEMSFAFIPAGEFQMGSEFKGTKYFKPENPVHTVKISQGFWLQQTEVTQAQWAAVMGKLPSNCDNGQFSGDSLGPERPIFCVSWDDTQEFIKKLNALNTGFKYRLPTEAEWEYAVRAGKKDNEMGDFNARAWYGLNSGGHPHDVATKEANSWNLYDMQGNVWEWCQDWYEPYPRETVTDPTGPKTGEVRIGRGSGWGDSSSLQLRLTIRGNGPPWYRDGYLGFRLVRQ